MSVTFDQKEDLRLRMADLEKKLADSEEERCKLEKTCNVLMRAFREEEKMQYRALNKKYEKFLEDCSVRKRRNDIILRSLCRIEDRSRALFAKTERLKLLKDRYITYLNISDHKKGEIHTQPLRSLSLSSSSQKFTSDATPRHLQWKTPLATHLKTERVKEAVRDLFEENRSPDAVSGTLFTTDRNFEKFEHKDNQGYEDKKEIGAFNVISSTETPVRISNPPNLLNQNKNGYDTYNPQANASPKQSNSEKLNHIQSFIAGNDTKEIRSREIITGYNDSIANTKKGLPPEEKHFSVENTNARHDPYSGNVVEKDSVEQSEKFSITKQNKSNDALFPKINWSPKMTAGDDERQELINEELEVKSDSQQDYQEESIPSQSPPKNSKPLPMGLDGVDYQNETYPESYYEQPVHRHNHTSIASDVILEEDETEQDLDEDEKNSTSDHSIRETQLKESIRESPEHRTVDESQWKTDASKQTEETNKGDVISSQVFDEVKSRESDSEKSLEAKQIDKSEKSESVVTEKSDKNKTTVKSNLIHLLESDSESFQIEHGDVASGNEDSDFDFSFHQN